MTQDIRAAAAADLFVIPEERYGFGYQVKSGYGYHAVADDRASRRAVIGDRVGELDTPVRNAAVHDFERSADAAGRGKHVLSSNSRPAEIGAQPESDLRLDARLEQLTALQRRARGDQHRFQQEA